MSKGLTHRVPFTRLLPLSVPLIFMLGLVKLFSQTPATGAVAGVTRDASNALLPGVTIECIREDGGDTRSTISDEEGRFRFLLLPPGAYDLRAGKKDFDSPTLSDLHISVTETIRVELRLRIATHMEQVDVSSRTTMVQTDASSLGRVVAENAITGLPLVTRNFTQITGLSPGVMVGVYNAGELGNGGTALSQLGKSNDGIYVHGARSYDNNWQLDGISVSDVQGAGAISGGIAIPNPNTLEEFKVQTGLYDAAFGRAAGGNISVITKTGSDSYHGKVFEFLRNDFLNANDYFLKQTAQRRPELKQNQFGTAFGGPIVKDKSLFFASYQGTRQINGLASGQARVACTASVSEPPITDDRSRAALGKLFGAMKGASGGIAVLPDGSNINPSALALLNFKLPDGSFLIPTPQTVDSSKRFASSGVSNFVEPCHYAEDQGLANLDHIVSQRSRIGGRLFIASSSQSVTFPGGALNPAGNIRGFASPIDSEFVVSSLAHTFILSNALLNEARIGFVRTKNQTGADAPFKWSDVGVSESETNRNNELPSLSILGSVSMAAVTPRSYTQNSFIGNDVLSLFNGAHTLKFGGSLTRLQDDLNFGGGASLIQFLSWPDFLLGLDANSNGTGNFSNIFQSADIFGLLDRQFRVWEGSAFAQDDFRITKALTLNLGLRYERIGHFADQLGRNASFDISKADTNPPPGGSLAGYMVGSNFPGDVPPGVIRAGNTFGNYGEGQNTISPRIGFALQLLPNSTHFALRGGYGVYHSRPTGQTATQSVIAAPFSTLRSSVGPSNAAATFQTPFAQPFPSPASFPSFIPYSPTTMTTVNVLAPYFRPAVIQEFSLNLQTELLSGWLLETGYVGNHGTHLQRFRSLNQALSASPTNPINGVTVNTVSNIGLRVPIRGIRPDSLREMESEGGSWYNALEVSLTKQLNRGLQFLASYSFSKVLDTDGADINSISSGNSLTLGNQNAAGSRWGRASFDRAHRFVLSTTWMLAGPPRGLLRTILGHWSLAGIATIQSGSALTIASTNSANLFGISQDRAELSGICSKGQLVSGGTLESKLNDYFNSACFTKPLVIGADGIGTAFGSSGTGIANGPGQANLDLALSKTMMVRWPVDNSSLQFRAEFFNALNHPQFANPDTNFSSSTFGVIASTAVNPRVGQLALTYSF